LTCLPAEAASRRICEARGWIVRLRLAGHWLLWEGNLHKNGQANSTCPQGSRLCLAIAARYEY
jgi:hypothetical protein